MKKDKKKNKFKKINIFNIVNIFVVTLFLVFLINLNVIPKKYLLILVGLLYLYCILCIVLTNLKFKVTKIIGVILSCISILSCIIGSYFSYTGDKFLSLAFNNMSDYELIQYYVITYSDSDYTSKNDINDTVYYTSEANIENAVETFKEYSSSETMLYEDVSDLFTKVENKELNFILVSKSLYSYIFENDTNLDKDNYKVIFKFNVKVEKENEEVEASSSFNIYIGGTDFANLNDFNMIVTINMDTHTILLTSIPRDYYIEEYGQNGKKDTLSYMGVNGIEVNKKSLENLFDIDIDYYLKINTSSLVELVDAVGGINYCSDVSFTTTHALVIDTYDDSTGEKLTINEGCQHLNGIQTLTLARERKAFTGGDRQRQKNCQEIIIDIFDSLKSVNTITNYSNILSSLNDLYETTLSRDLIEEIIKDTIDNGDWTFEQQSVDGSDAQDYVHLTTLKDYVMYPDMDTVTEAREKILNTLE